MRLSIDIRVKIPDTQRDSSLDFVGGVMEVFHRIFPGAEPIYEPGGPSPVTVSYWNDDGTPIDLSRDPDTDVSINT